MTLFAYQQPGPAQQHQQQQQQQWQHQHQQPHHHQQHYMHQSAQVAHQPPPVIPCYSLFGGSYPLKPLDLAAILSPPHPTPNQEKRPSLVATTATGAVLPPPGFAPKRVVDAQEKHADVDPTSQVNARPTSLHIPPRQSDVDSHSDASSPMSAGSDASMSTTASSAPTSRKNSIDAGSSSSSGRSSPANGAFSIRVLDAPQPVTPGDNASLSASAQTQVHTIRQLTPSPIAVPQATSHSSAAQQRAQQRRRNGRHH